MVFWKDNKEVLFVFLLTFGYLFPYMLAKPLHLHNEYFTIPFRFIMLIFSVFLIADNRQNLKKNISIQLFFTLFWCFYVVKVCFSYRYYPFVESDIIPKEKDVYLRVFGLIYLPSMALLSIDYNKINFAKLINYIFLFLTLVLGISLVYELIVVKKYFASSGIFSVYYISSSHYALSLLLIAIYRLQYPKLYQRKWLSYLAIILAIIVIIFSSSRSPVFALGFIGLLFLIWKGNWRFWLLSCISFLLFALVLYLVKDYSSEYSFVYRTYQAIFEGNASGRGYYMNKGIAYFLKNPLLGNRFLLEDGTYPHNIFLEIAMSMGVLGLILFFLWIKPLLQFQTKYLVFWQEKNLFLLFFVQYFALSLTSCNLFSNIEFWYFSCIFVSLIVLENEKIKSYNSSRDKT